MGFFFEPAQKTNRNSSGESLAQLQFIREIGVIRKLQSVRQ
jgi:hypothetical protein